MGCHKKALTFWKQLQRFADISSGAALGLWTLTALILAFKGKFTAEIADAYKTVVLTFGAYSVSRVAATHPKVSALLSRLWKKAS